MTEDHEPDAVVAYGHTVGLICPSCARDTPDGAWAGPELDAHAVAAQVNRPSPFASVEEPDDEGRVFCTVCDAVLVQLRRGWIA